LPGIFTSRKKEKRAHLCVVREEFYPDRSRFFVELFIGIDRFSQCTVRALYVFQFGTILDDLLRIETYLEEKVKRNLQQNGELFRSGTGEIFLECYETELC